MSCEVILPSENAGASAEEIVQMKKALDLDGSLFLETDLS
jgi:hypothetical protein